MAFLRVGHQPSLPEASEDFPEGIEVIGPGGGVDDNIVQVGGRELVLRPQEDAH